MHWSGLGQVLYTSYGACRIQVGGEFVSEYHPSIVALDESNISLNFVLGFFMIHVFNWKAKLQERFKLSCTFHVFTTCVVWIIILADMSTFVFVFFRYCYTDFGQDISICNYWNGRSFVSAENTLCIKGTQYIPHHKDSFSHRGKERITKLIREY